MTSLSTQHHLRHALCEPSNILHKLLDLPGQTCDLLFRLCEIVHAEIFPVSDLPGTVESGTGTGGDRGGDPNSNSNSRCFKRSKTNTDKSKYQPTEKSILDCCRGFFRYLPLLRCVFLILVRYGISLLSFSYYDLQIYSCQSTAKGQ